MSKFSQLLGRLEEQAIRIHELEHTHTREREAHRRVLADLREKNGALQDDLLRLKQPRNADTFAQVSYLYDELHRVILDAHSLIERENLSDTEKVRSIAGLFGQVMNTEWFAQALHDAPAVTKAPRTRRQPKKPVEAMDAPPEEDEDEPNSDLEDQRDYVNLRD